MYYFSDNEKYFTKNMCEYVYSVSKCFSILFKCFLACQSWNSFKDKTYYRREILGCMILVCLFPESNELQRTSLGKFYLYIYTAAK